MINVRTIRKLTNNDGLTLRAGRVIRYKTGWQVATEGVECSTPEQVMRCQVLRGQLRCLAGKWRVLC